MQRVNKAACLLLALGVLLATGCKHEAKGYWKDTRRYYREYLNTPAKLDLEDKGEVAPAEARLAEGFAGIDIQLRALERALENSDPTPRGPSRCSSAFRGSAAWPPWTARATSWPSSPKRP